MRFWLAISPDGERMALSTRFNPALVRVLDMSSRDLVAENTAQFPLSVAWTPDSAEILVSTVEAGLRRGAPGGDLRPLATGARFVGSLATSPGGSLIYESVDSDVDMLRFSLADPAGEPDRSIASSTRAESSARISPNGAKITFASSRTGETEIWKVPAEGGEALRLSRNGGGRPRESPDGRYVYYAGQLESWAVGR
jgi:TolB protein